MTKKHKKKLIKEVKEGTKRGLAGTLALYMFLTASMLLIPTIETYALTGGPSQPEVQSFEPIGTSDMVNLFSGDFTYNIPLLDVEGYPINLSYNSGITMDQEASWTGLGWNVNVGNINRALRGLPDDFNGETITTKTNIKKNTTIGLDASIGDIELFGLDLDAGSIAEVDFNASLGVNYNNYNGVGVNLGLGLGAEFNLPGESDLLGTAGLGLNSSSSGGLDISPSVGLSNRLGDNTKISNSLGGNIGSSFNSRAGLTSLSIGASLTIAKEEGLDKKRFKEGNGNQGLASASINLQQPTYTPTITNSMRTFGMTARIKVSASTQGIDHGFSIGASYNEQKLKDPVIESSSFGYLYSQNGQDNSNARHDFNRMNDGSMGPNTPYLALTNYTYDIYSVAGQGVGGSYRPFRSQVGYVYDNNATSTSSSIPFTVELGGGSLFHGGTQVGTTIVKSNSGAWKQGVNGFNGDNVAKNIFNFNTSDGTSDFEPYVFREANEASVVTDQGYYDEMGGDEAVKFKLKNKHFYNVDVLPELQKSNDDPGTAVSKNYKEGRVKRNITIQDLTVKEVKDYGVGVQDYMPNSYAQSYTGNDDHLGQLVSIGNDGMRYVYGQPAYNKVQKEVTFAVGKTLLDGPSTGTPNYNLGLVPYSGGQDNSVNNEQGLDNYFQEVETPGYTHSFLLTSVLSDDYVDADGIKGPSKGDLGSYTRFEYDNDINDYRWRVPVEPNMASFNEGLKSDPTDDKGSYVYGEKELFYLDKIETKNFIALFHKSIREDAKGVLDENGGINPGMSMKKLDSIQLMTHTEYDKYLSNASYDPIILKTVHFRYDYELCQNTPNSTASTKGKLTLKKVFFTYRDSQKGKISPYVFKYEGLNPDYNLKGYDRWGCYKPNLANSAEATELELATYEYPYVDQDKSLTDAYTSAWTMTRVELPSGGSIAMEYESDDYAYVQNKKAMEMVKIVSVGDDNLLGNGNLGTSTSSNAVLPVSDNANKNRRIFFEKDPAISTSEYVKGIENLYFRCLAEFADPNVSSNRYDFVSSYCEIEEYDSDVNNSLGWILLKPVSFRDHNNGNTNPDKYNPIALAGIQFGQLHLPRLVWESPNISDDGFGAQTASALWQTLANFVEGFKNPNKTLFDKKRGTKIVMNKSWLRLNDVNDFKLGGGCRVKKITISDSWDEMVANATPFDYGQEYSYVETKTVNGNEFEFSSGVASYEPQLGGDENPFKEPIFFDNQKRMAPDQRFYQEKPLGEAFFPSASIGYSKVTVRNLTHTGVSRTATGKVVHEFYTAKEYPTHVDQTDLSREQHKTSPFSLLSVFGVTSRDYYTGSQGFAIETNDMHGKQKAQSVYQENQDEPITKVEYEYQSVQGSEFNTSRLSNDVQVIYKDGRVENNQIGVNFDMIADFRESTVKVRGISSNINLDVLSIGPLPFPIPMIWPKITGDKTLYRSAVLTKVIQKYGVLKNTVATDLGSVVSTKNLAYDAETGQVLLTETTTNYDDKVYSMNYPAYWHYDQMGPAYKNIGFTIENVNVINGKVIHPDAKYFAEGDEVYVHSGANTYRQYVMEASNSEFEILNPWGTPANLSNTTIKIIRSGRRNMQSQMMASITTLSNPLNNFKTNVYENVLQASAIEFDDKWRTYCDCNGSVTTASSNPYFLGTKGNFRPKVSYLHLSDRIQSDYNNNTNIREDGVFESYRPYYRLNSNNEWVFDRKDWTYTAEVTEFNPYGQELANEDALGRESAAQFGFNQTLAKAVAANAGYRDIGFTSFEDDDFSECADNHFKFDQRANRVSTDSHSGRYSTRVTSGNEVTIYREIAERCDMAGCSLEIGVISPTETNYAIVTTNEISQHSISVNVISGNPTITPTSNGPKVILSGTFVIEFQASIPNGCQDVHYMRVTNGSIQP